MPSRINPTLNALNVTTHPHPLSGGSSKECFTIFVDFANTVSLFLSEWILYDFEQLSDTRSCEPFTGFKIISFVASYFITISEYELFSILTCYGISQAYINTIHAWKFFVIYHGRISVLSVMYFLVCSNDLNFVRTLQQPLNFPRRLAIHFISVLLIATCNVAFQNLLTTKPSWNYIDVWVLLFWWGDKKIGLKILWFHLLALYFQISLPKSCLFLSHFYQWCMKFTDYQ